MGEAVGQLGRAEYPLEKAFAEFFVGSFDALHFDDVDSSSEYQSNRSQGCAVSSMTNSISRTAVARPTTTARLMMLWPMFNSTK